MPTPQKTKLTRRANDWRKALVRESEKHPAYDRPWNRPRLEDALVRAKARDVLRRFSAGRPAQGTGSSRGLFRPGVKLDPSVLRDRRANTPVETRAGWDGKGRVGRAPNIQPVPPLQRVNPSVIPPRRRTIRDVPGGGAGVSIRQPGRKPARSGGARAV